MLSLDVNGFTAAQLREKIHREPGHAEYRIRAELQTAKGAFLRDVTGLLLGPGRGFIRNTADAEVHRTGRCRIRDKLLDLATYADLIISGESGGPEVFLRLGDASGTTAVDSSGNGRNGVYVGSPSLNQGSLLAGDDTNGSVTLNGTTQTVTIAHNAAYNSDEVSVEAWYRLEPNGATQTIVARDNFGASRQWGLMTTTTTTVFYVRIGGVTKTASFPLTTADNNIYQAIGTYDGSLVQLYLNGVAVAELATTGAPDMPTVDITIGSNNTALQWAKGGIDEVSVWSRALTAKEGLEHYQAGSAQRNEVLYDKNLRLQFFCAIKMDGNGTDNTPWAEFPLGRFLMSAPRRDADKFGIYREVDLYDESYNLKNSKITSRYTVAAGVNYITAVTAALQAAGLDTTGYSLSATDLILPAARDWEPGSGTEGVSFLQIINELLFDINYKSFRFNGAGIGIAAQYVLPKDRASEYTYETDDLSIIFPEVSAGVELQKVVNEVVAVIEDPAQPIDSATSTNTKPSSPTNTSKSGVGQTNRKQLDSFAANSTVLQGQADRVLTEESMSIEVIEYHTAITPHHDDLDKNTFKHINIPHPLNINADFIEYEWETELNEAGRTRHLAKRSLDVTT